MESSIGYIVLCLIVPLLWGAVSARLFDWAAARRRPPERDAADEGTVDMYHI